MQNPATWQPKDVREAFFPVESRPLFMTDGSALNRYQKLNRHFAIVDVNREHPFTVVTDDYKLVTNEQAFKMASAVMKKVFLTLQPDQLVCLNITMPKTRSFCHIDLIHKDGSFSPWEKDKWTAFLRITNSYNRTRLLRVELGFCRWICMNGMIFGSKSVEVSYAHTKRGTSKIDKFAENIGDIRKLEAKLVENLIELKRYHVPESEMLSLICRVFEIDADDDDLEKQKRRDDLVAMREHTKSLTKKYFSDMGQHAYAALNVLTDYATRPVGVLSPESSIHGFQQKAGNWMDEFIAAISSPKFSFDEYLADYRYVAALIEGM